MAVAHESSRKIGTAVTVRMSLRHSGNLTNDQELWLMLPHKFAGNVAQRMYVWAGILAYLALLYAGTEIIHHQRLAEFSRDSAIIKAVSSELTVIEALLTKLRDEVAVQTGSSDPADLKQLDASIKRIVQVATGDVRDRAADFHTALT